MALNIKNALVESLATEITEMTGESKTEAIRRALEERKQRLSFQVVHENRADELRSFLEREVWSVIRARSAGRCRAMPDTTCTSPTAARAAAASPTTAS